MEFKVHDQMEEKDFQNTVRAALRQIDTMDYKATLVAEGICEERIRKYGFAFEGKKGSYWVNVRDDSTDKTEYGGK